MGGSKDPVQEIFELIDADEDGSVTEKEVEKFCASFPVQVTPQQLRATVPTGAKLNLAAFRTAAQRLEQATGLPQQQMLQHFTQQCHSDLFRELDTDNSGDINLTELRWLIDKMKLPLSSEDIRRIFSKVDADGSGSIEAGEFSGILDHIAPHVNLARFVRDFHKVREQTRADMAEKANVWGASRINFSNRKRRQQSAPDPEPEEEWPRLRKAQRPSAPEHHQQQQQDPAPAPAAAPAQPPRAAPRSRPAPPPLQRLRADTTTTLGGPPPPGQHSTPGGVSFRTPENTSALLSQPSGQLRQSFPAPHAVPSTPAPGPQPGPPRTPPGAPPKERQQPPKTTLLPPTGGRSFAGAARGAHPRGDSPQRARAVTTFRPAARGPPRARGVSTAAAGAPPQPTTLRVPSAASAASSLSAAARTTSRAGGYVFGMAGVAAESASSSEEQEDEPAAAPQQPPPRSPATPHQCPECLRLQGELRGCREQLARRDAQLRQRSEALARAQVRLDSQQDRIAALERSLAGGAADPAAANALAERLESERREAERERSELLERVAGAEAAAAEAAARLGGTAEESAAADQEIWALRAALDLRSAELQKLREAMQSVAAACAGGQPEVAAQLQRVLTEERAQAEEAEIECFGEGGAQGAIAEAEERHTAAQERAAERARWPQQECDAAPAPQPAGAGGAPAAAAAGAGQRPVAVPAAAPAARGAQWGASLSYEQLQPPPRAARAAPAPHARAADQRQAHPPPQREQSQQQQGESREAAQLRAELRQREEQIAALEARLDKARAAILATAGVERAPREEERAGPRERSRSQQPRAPCRTPRSTAVWSATGVLPGAGGASLRSASASPGAISSGGLSTDGRRGLSTDGRRGLSTDGRRGLSTDGRRGLSTDGRRGLSTDGLLGVPPRYAAQSNAAAELRALLALHSAAAEPAAAPAWQSRAAPARHGGRLSPPRPSRQPAGHWVGPGAPSDEVWRQRSRSASPPSRRGPLVGL